MQKKVRVIIDTNLSISFLIGKHSSKLKEIIYSNRNVLVYSHELLTEFLEATRRAKFRRYFTFDESEKLIEIVSKYGDFAEVTTKVEVCRDDKDNFLLALATNGKPDFLLTGDKDLLTLKSYKETTITTISAFLEDK